MSDRRIYNRLYGIWKFDASDSLWTRNLKGLYFSAILFLIPSIGGLLLLEGIGVQWEVARKLILLPPMIVMGWYVWRRFGKYELGND